MGNLATRGHLGTRNSWRELEGMDSRCRVVRLCGWFYLSPVRTWLDFVLPNSLVQPLALCEALAGPKSE